MKWNTIPRSERDLGFRRILMGWVVQTKLRHSGKQCRRKKIPSPKAFRVRSKLFKTQQFSNDAFLANAQHPGKNWALFTLWRRAKPFYSKIVDLLGTVWYILMIKNLRGWERELSQLQITQFVERKGSEEKRKEIEMRRGRMERETERDARPNEF